MGDETEDDWEALSLLLEQATGYDSIPTIDIHYFKDSGVGECVWPGCRFRRRDALALWRHVHFGPHGRSFGEGANTYAELCALAEALGASA